MELWDLADLCTPWCVHVAATLRVAGHIEAGISEIDKLAQAAGADAEALGRVMRHLVRKGLFEELEQGRFTLNEAACGLLNEGTLIGLDLEGFGGRMAHSWGTLLQAVKTGRPAYKDVFGKPFWEDLESHGEIAAQFDTLMGPAGHGIPDAQVLIDPADWDSVRTVVDVGGGTGSLLAEVLKARPGVRGILVDQPATVERSAPLFRKAGVEARVTAVGQSFFEPLPAGGDLYLLKNVLADWPDAEASMILRRCAEAAQPSGRVVILGGISPGEAADPELLMLVLVGGKSRTLMEFRELAGKSGLTFQAAARQPSGRFIVECRAISSRSL